MDEIEKALASLQLKDGGDRPKAIAILAEASKTELRARSGLADATTLKNLTEIVEASIDDDRQTTDLALRCIGNASIDNNEARETLTQIGFSWTLRCLRHEMFEENGSARFNDFDTAELTAKVLYNICCDYEPAQRKCFEEHVHYSLIQLCTATQLLGNDSSALLIELLYWISSQKQPDSTTTDPLPQTCLSALLRLPSLYGTHDDDSEPLSIRGHQQLVEDKPSVQVRLDTDDWPLLVETCLIFIRDAQVQNDIVQLGLGERVLQLLELNEERIQDTTEEDLQKLLIPLSTGLVWCLSDISALPAFSQAYPLDSQVLVYARNAIATLPVASANVRRLTAACQILGNSLWSIEDPERFSWLVQREHIQESLWRRMADTEDPELLHGAAGVLIQLSRFEAGREDMGSNGREANPAFVLEKLCRHETPQLKEDGVKLLRALGRDCPGNQWRFADLEREVRQSAVAAQADLAVSDGSVLSIDDASAGPNGHVEP